MAVWTTSSNPFGDNRTPGLLGLASDGSGVMVPVAVDPTTGAVITESATASTSSVNLVKVGGTNVSLGQTTKSASIPVTLASDQNNALETGGNLATIATNTSGLATSADQTNGNQQTKVTDGTNIVNVLKSDGTAVGQNAQLVSGSYLSTSFTTTTAQAVGSTDVGNYSWVSVQVLAQGGSSTVTFQTSNDNNTWVSQTLVVSTSTTGASVSSTTSVNLYHGAIQGRYFRLNVTGIVSGTTSGVIVFATSPRVLQSLGVLASQTGTWSVGANSATGSTVPANGFYQSVLAKTVSPTAASTGNLVGVLGDVMGEPLVATGGLVTSAVPANASNVVVKGSAGRLCNVLVTTTGANPMVIYDNATTSSGTIIGCLPANPIVGTTYTFNMPAAAGITIAGSATNPAVTVSWV